jgi:hypothetical protein
MHSILRYHKIIMATGSWKRQDGHLSRFLELCGGRYLKRAVATAGTTTTTTTTTIANTTTATAPTTTVTSTITTSQSYVTTNGQSVGQSVLLSSHIWSP